MSPAVHSSIRWSKCSPWLETEVLDLDEHLAMLEKLREKKNMERCTAKLVGDISSSEKKTITDLGFGQPSAQKRRSSGLPMRIHSAASTH